MVETLVVYGDSLSAKRYFTTQYWPSGYYGSMVAAVTGWERAGYDDTAKAAAIGGSTLHTDALAQFDDRLASYAPTKVIVNYGTNDYLLMGKTTNLDTWKADWDTLLTRIREIPTVSEIVVLGLMATVWGNGLAGQWSYEDRENRDLWLHGRMNVITMQSCDEHGGIWVPLDDITKQHIRDDGHLNVRGHGKVTGEILAALGYI